MVEHSQRKSEDELAHVASDQVGDVEDFKKDGTRDAVFGDVSKDGPNYRNVRSTINVATVLKMLTTLAARMDRNYCVDDEDPDWPWRVVDSTRV
jgi:hypothetical protein